jgi:hypothetical protein
MSHQSPKNVLQFPHGRGVSMQSRGRSSFSMDEADVKIQEILDRLQEENSELRGKAIDLILEIRSLQGL